MLQTNQTEIVVGDSVAIITRFAFVAERGGKVAAGASPAGAAGALKTLAALVRLTAWRA
jgi:hypothetical protein